jgi:protein CpxP
MTRMNKTTLLTVAVAVLLLMNIAVISFVFITRPPNPDGPEGPEGPGGRRQPKEVIIERLRFDRGQVERYEALIEQHRGSIRTLTEEMQEVKRELYATLSSPQGEKTDSLTKILGSLVQKVEQVHFDHVLAIKGLCRPDQAEDFDRFSHELARLFSPKEQRRR